MFILFFYFIFCFSSSLKILQISVTFVILKFQQTVITDVLLQLPISWLFLGAVFATKILNVRKLLISIAFTGTAKSKIDLCRVSPLSVILKSSQWKCTKKIILHSQWTYIILVSKGLKVEGKKFNFS